jgi:hypothetical protein
MGKKWDITKEVSQRVERVSQATKERGKSVDRVDGSFLRVEPLSQGTP